MRADEPAEFCKDIMLMIKQNVTRDYINQLRYERLTAKSKYFRLRMLHYSDSSCYSEIKFDQLLRIAEAFEARAKRIKEGM